MQEEKTIAIDWYNASNQRYYHVKLQRDLLGDLIVFQTWGGLGSRRGGNKSTFIKSYSAALQYLEKLHKRRLEHDYQLIDHKELELLFVPNSSSDLS